MGAVLITRPREEAELLTRELAAKGLEVITEPLLFIEAMPENEPALSEALELKPHAIIASSKRAIGVAGGLSAERDIPVFSVGEATAQYAEALGFTGAGTAETAEALLKGIEKHFPLEQKARLLYLRGEDISTDMAAALKAKGFKVDSVVLYRAAAIAEFSAFVQSAMAAGHISAVMLFSRRTATTYVELVKLHALEAVHRAMRAVCMSPAVAQAAQDLPWGSVHIAAKPDMEYMIKSLG